MKLTILHVILLGTQCASACIVLDLSPLRTFGLLDETEGAYSLHICETSSSILLAKNDLDTITLEKSPVGVRDLQAGSALKDLQLTFSGPLCRGTTSPSTNEFRFHCRKPVSSSDELTEYKIGEADSPCHHIVDVYTPNACSRRSAVQLLKDDEGNDTEAPTEGAEAQTEPVEENPAEQPEETEQPDETEKPTETEQPDETEQPSETKQPEETKQPATDPAAETQPSAETQPPAEGDATSEPEPTSVHTPNDGHQHETKIPLTFPPSSTGHELPGLPGLPTLPTLVPVAPPTYPSYESDCYAIVTDPSDLGREYIFDLNPLKQAVLYGEAPLNKSLSYEIALCGTLQRPCGKLGQGMIHEYVGDQCTSIVAHWGIDKLSWGAYDEMEYTKGIHLRLQGLDPICMLEKEPHTYQVDIFLRCDDNTEQIKEEEDFFYVFQLKTDPCHYQFELVSPKACPLQNVVADEGSHMSPAGLFFLILFLILLGSFVFICGYKYQGGARGWEVLPFYEECRTFRCCKPKRSYSKVNINEAGTDTKRAYGTAQMSHVRKHFSL